MVIIEKRPFIIRTFGTGKDADTATWDLDILNENGIKTVDGIIVHIKNDYSDDLIEQIPDISTIISKQFSHIHLSENLSTVELIVQWKSDLHLRGVPQEFCLMDISDPAFFSSVDCKDILLGLREFIENYIENLRKIPPPEFLQIDKLFLKKFNVKRIWDLDNKSLIQVTEKYLKALSAKKQEFPRSLKSQIEQVLIYVLGAWKSSDRDTHSYLSICFKQNFRLTKSHLSGAGVFFSPSINSQVRGYLSFGHSVEQIKSGAVKVEPITSQVISSLPSLNALCLLQQWLDSSAHQNLRLEFVFTQNDCFVINAYREKVPDDNWIRSVGDLCDTRNEHTNHAIVSIPPQLVDELLLPVLSATENRHLVWLGKGIAASQGVFSGILCITPSKANELISQNSPFVFVNISPEPEIVNIALNAGGLVFSTGGTTSHIAVISRSSGKPCVLGVENLTISEDHLSAMFGSNEIKEGEWITVDGTNGEVYAGYGNVKPYNTSNYSALNKIFSYCEEVSSIDVYANVDIATEAKIAFNLGAKGIGLCRLEHLLARPSYLTKLQSVMALAWIIRPLSENLLYANNNIDKWPSSMGAHAIKMDVDRQVHDDPAFQTYLHEIGGIEEILVGELTELFACANGKPVTIRLVDPPLSEFISKITIENLQKQEVISLRNKHVLEELASRKDSMIGLRGIRICSIAPEFTGAQIRGIIKAAKAGAKKVGSRVLVDVMAPFVIDPIEISFLRKIIEREKLAYLSQEDNAVIRVGSMIETPRSALKAKELAKVCDFLSFGTNDLTQLTWGCSRDYAETEFLSHFNYQELEVSPFKDLDETGVGRLIEIAIKEARVENPGITIGVCGEHSGNPNNVDFFSKIGVNYLSCTPFRIPTIRFVTGQVSLLRHQGAH